MSILDDLLAPFVALDSHGWSRPTRAKAANAAKSEQPCGLRPEFARCEGVRTSANEQIDSQTFAGIRVRDSAPQHPFPCGSSQHSQLSRGSSKEKDSRTANDPDRWSWFDDPSLDAAMNSAEIALFVRRHARLLALGFSDGEADRMADRLKLRDREGDPRCSCAECRHVASRVCPAGGPVPLVLLQHCPTYAPALQ